ncbi:hypothetical protein [Kitasatospora sp. NPDC059571]|uniref:hypothetical protein n=1 Tax=Kitasatospora sp. NPDC059571 TaxID=3346871 RepID=UPI0036CB9D89
MAKVTVTLDADQAIEVMLLSGTRSPQDAIELVVLDYLARGRRTEARAGEAADAHRTGEPPHRAQEG